MTETTTHTPESIKAELTEFLGISPDAFDTTKGGEHSKHWNSQVLAYCLWLYTDLRRTEIARITGRDGSNIAASIKMIKERCLVDRDYRDKIIEIENLFE